MKNADHAAAETLEARRLMAAAALATSTSPYAGGTMLRITGTPGNDTITLSYDGSVFRLKTAAGFAKSLSPKVTAVKIMAGAGHDRVTVDKTVGTPVFLYGEDGNDTLTGGAGDDHLYGGAGTNYLYGNSGRDTLVSLGGSTADGLNGGAGDDVFWVDNKPAEKIYDASAYEAANAVNRVGTFATNKFASTTKVEAIANTLGATAGTLRLRDPDVSNTNYVYKRFDDRPLFAKAGPTADDVKQGQIGDCYFLSTLAGTAGVSPQSIRNMVADLGDGTYAVRFKTASGTNQFIRVDNDLAVFNTRSTDPAYAGLGAQNSMWVAVVEKAYAFARKGVGTYASLNSGWMTDALKAIGAKTTQTLWNSDADNADDFIDFVESRLKAGEVVTLAVYSDNDTLNLVGSHAYTVVRVEKLANGQRQLIIRNPWAMDGYRTQDGRDDGYLKLSAKQAYEGIDAFASGRVA